MRFASILLLSAFLVPLPLEAAPLDGLVPHRAVYDVTLDEASERSGIAGIKGRMVYEARGSACEGFSVRFRFFQNVRTPRRQYSSDQRTSTFEAADGSRYEFVNRTFFNGQQEKEVKGSAIADADTLDVTVEKPDAETVELPIALFPTAHLAAVIEAARSGKRFLAADVFDGSDDGNEVMSTNAVIGREIRAGDAATIAGPAKDQLSGKRSWPVSIAYFEGDPDASGERLPSYQVSFPLFENGVSGDLSMRYDDYALKAELTDLEYLEQPDCPSD